MIYANWLGVFIGWLLLLFGLFLDAMNLIGSIIRWRSGGNKPSMILLLPVVAYFCGLGLIFRGSLATGFWLAIGLLVLLHFICGWLLNVLKYALRPKKAN